MAFFPLFSLFYCLRIKASIVQLCLNSYTLTLSIKVLHRNATWTNYSHETFPCLKSLVVGIIRSLMLWGFFRSFFGYPLRFLKATLIPALINQVWWSYKRVIRGGGGDYWSRIENKMTVSHFTDNKFGISRFTRQKNIFIRSVSLSLVKNYSRRTTSFDVPGADPGFFLGGGALVSCSASTSINHIVFFLAEYPLY